MCRGESDDLEEHHRDGGPPLIGKTGSFGLVAATGVLLQQGGGRGEGSSHPREVGTVDYGFDRRGKHPD